MVVTEGERAAIFDKTAENSAITCRLHNFSNGRTWRESNRYYQMEKESNVIEISSDEEDYNVNALINPLAAVDSTHHSCQHEQNCRQQSSVRLLEFQLSSTKRPGAK